MSHTILSSLHSAASCDWHDCAADASTLVRAHITRPDGSFYDLMWTRCPAHTPTADLDARAGH